MEQKGEQNPYGSGQSAMGIIVLVMALGAACVIALMIWQLSQSSTARYEAKQSAISAQAYAEREKARYEAETKQAKLENKIDEIDARSIAYQERLGTLAVVLAGLNSEEEKHLLAYERWWVEPLVWFIVVAGAIVAGMVVIRVLDPYLDRLISARFAPGD